MALPPPLTLLVAIGVLLAPASGAPFCNSGCPKVTGCTVMYVAGVNPNCAKATTAAECEAASTADPT